MGVRCGGELDRVMSSGDECNTPRTLGVFGLMWSMLREHQYVGHGEVPRGDEVGSESGLGALEN